MSLKLAIKKKKLTKKLGNKAQGSKYVAPKGLTSKIASLKASAKVKGKYTDREVKYEVPTRTEEDKAREMSEEQIKRSEEDYADKQQRQETAEESAKMEQEDEQTPGEENEMEDPYSYAFEKEEERKRRKQMEDDFLSEE